ncbi:MAG: polysaccharide pyruvyl transferase family protein, partial [Patescibacteria group bacterium]
MQYLLVGNYGVSNAGDEILREYFLERFPEIDWKVLSAHPEKGEFPRFPAGLRSFFSLRWLSTLRELRKADGMVFGGGSLLTDTESVRACFIWFLHAAAAWLLHKPIILAFQGIGPFRTKAGEWCSRWVVRRAAFISVRDEESYNMTSRGHVEA